MESWDSIIIITIIIILLFFWKVKGSVYMYGGGKGHMVTLG